MPTAKETVLQRSIKVWDFITERLDYDDEDAPYLDPESELDFSDPITRAPQPALTEEYQDETQ